MLGLNRMSLLAGILVALVVGVFASARSQAAPPWEQHGRLQVSANGRYLQHANETPLLWIGDTAWALFYKLQREEVVEYLDRRSEQGFNVIQAVAYWYPHGEDGPGPTNAANRYGHSPFVGDTDHPETAQAKTAAGGSPDDPNDYWDNADFIIRETRRRGLYLALLPCWGRAYINPQMPGSARVVFTEQQAHAYGRFLGKRYRNEPHIVWVLGGDANATKGSAGDQFTVYRAMAEGIAEGVTGKTPKWNQPDPAWDAVMMTYHPDGAPAYNSSNWFHQDQWLDVNGIETWKSIDKVYETVARDFALNNPVKPTMLLEGAYEQGKYPAPGERVSAQKARQQAYHTFFAGGAGHTYGGFPVWDFTHNPRHDSYGHTWRDAMQFPAAPQIATIMRRLLEENRWSTLSPCSKLIAGDPGQGAAQVVGMRANDGRRLLVYFPQRSKAKIHLDLTGRLPAAASWFDPRNGDQVEAGSHEVGATVSFNPPPDWEDAVLIVTAE